MSFNCLDGPTKPGMECATGISKETWVHRDQERLFGMFQKGALQNCAWCATTERKQKRRQHAV